MTKAQLEAEAAYWKETAESRLRTLQSLKETVAAQQKSTDERINKLDADVRRVSHENAQVARDAETLRSERDQARAALVRAVLR